MKPFKDKTVLITGGTAGIGQALVRCFVEKGAHVLAGDIDTPGGEKLAAELGDACVFHTLDVSSELSFLSAIEQAVKQWGHLDVLINNAGVVLPSEPVQSTSNKAFDRFVNVNLRGVFHGCKLAYPHLTKTKGCVLNISSMAGVSGQASHAVYAATKGAINALTKSTAVDWGPEGIRINALCPTGVWTDTLRAWCDSQSNQPEIVNYLDRIHALGYCPQADEIVSVAAFLCSDDAKFVTGCIMPVSGGSECGYKL